MPAWTVRRNLGVTLDDERYGSLRLVDRAVKSAAPSYLQAMVKPCTLSWQQSHCPSFAADQNPTFSDNTSTSHFSQGVSVLQPEWVFVGWSNTIWIPLSSHRFDVGGGLGCAFHYFHNFTKLTIWRAPHFMQWFGSVQTSLSSSPFSFSAQLLLSLFCVHNKRNTMNAFEKRLSETVRC